MPMRINPAVSSPASATGSTASGATSGKFASALETRTSNAGATTTRAGASPTLTLAQRRALETAPVPTTPADAAATSPAALPDPAIQFFASQQTGIATTSVAGTGLDSD